MNRLYKVVWNRTRACWQVVSELVGNTGRAKAVRRPGAKRLAAALALLLAWPAGGSATAWAAGSVVVSGVQTTGKADNGKGGTGNSYMAGSIAQNPFYSIKNNVNLQPQYYYQYQLRGVKATKSLTTKYFYAIDQDGVNTFPPGVQAQLLAVLRAAQTDSAALANYIAGLSEGDPLYVPAGYTLTIDLSAIRLPEPQQPLSPAYDAVSLNNGAIWRPMDWSKTEIYLDVDRLENIDGLPWEKVSLKRNADGTFAAANFTPIGGLPADMVSATQNLLLVNKLDSGTNAAIDLSHLNTSGENPRVLNLQDPHNGYLGGVQDAGGNYIARTFYAKEATLGEGTAFRLGLYMVSPSAGGTNPQDYIRGILPESYTHDSVYIEKASRTANAEGKTNLYIQLGWVPGLDRAGTSQAGSGQRRDSTIYPVVFSILEGAENFTVTGQAGYADGLFSKYYITPVIKEAPNAGGYYLVSGTYDSSTGTYLNAVYGGTAWYLDSYSYYYAGISESGLAAADNIVPVVNLWRSDYLGLFRRAGALHRQNYPDGRAETDNVWAETWRGRFKSASGYGRSVSQSYDALQVGYDKQLAKDFYHGRAYAGLYVSNQDASSDTATGGGDQESNGIGAYAAWVGDKGHYLDFGVQAAKLKNDFHFTDSGGRVTAGYDTWAYGLGAQYGYRKELAGGWFLEPQAALFYGRMDGVSYGMSNRLTINQADSVALTGKLGVAAGKNLGESGNVYARAAVLRDFRGRGGLAMQYGTASQPVDVPDGKDTWYELGLGGNFRISPAGSFNLDLSRTVGSNIGNEWRVNGLFEWAWGGGKAGVPPTVRTDEELLAGISQPADAGGGTGTQPAAAQP
ncbi:MAG TPA: autotransporter outer membrane beta-barrel domain-containing protein, partial [Selenomonadales bacterium]|nr:autotransporter outer membrane beta-barrel domain-containing protein [Selenomonadales bacterium]